MRRFASCKKKQKTPLLGGALDDKTK